MKNFACTAPMLAGRSSIEKSGVDLANRLEWAKCVQRGLRTSNRGFRAGRGKTAVGRENGPTGAQNTKYQAC